MSVKAKLKIRLLADEVVVAEAEDPVLWRKVLASIQAPVDKDDSERDDRDQLVEGDNASGSESADAALRNFAAELGISVAALEGAATPSKTEPYIQLNQHNWETLKKVTPARGPGSVAPAALAATLAALWARHADLPTPSTALMSKILQTINLPTKNLTRALENCEWLLRRGSGWVINPNHVSEAIRVASAYCKREAPSRARND